jgi:molybdopterin converting factor small subunit
MEIKVHLYGAFKKLAESSTFSCRVEEGTTVGGLMDLLKLPDPVYRMALVNNVRVPESAVLKPGDEVHLFQPIGGG